MLILGDPPLKLDMHPVRRRYEQFYLSDEERRYFDAYCLELWELTAAADYLNVSRLYYASCMTLYLLAKNHCWKTYKLIQAMGWNAFGKEVRLWGTELSQRTLQRDKMKLATVWWRGDSSFGRISLRGSGTGGMGL